MGNDNLVGEFRFGTFQGRVKATRTGIFTIKTIVGIYSPLYGEISLDFGEINTLMEYVRNIYYGKSAASEKNPLSFWRTDGSKIIEVFSFDGPTSVFKRGMTWLNFKTWKFIDIREGGTKNLLICYEDCEDFLNNLNKLITNAPYKKFIELNSTEPVSNNERFVREVEFPFINPATAKSALEQEQEITQEITYTLNFETTLGIGVDYFVKLDFENKFGFTSSHKKTSRTTIKMRAEPGENKVIRVCWYEILETGFGNFTIQGKDYKIPYTRTVDLIARQTVEVKQ